MGRSKRGRIGARGGVLVRKETKERGKSRRERNWGRGDLPSEDGTKRLSSKSAAMLQRGEIVTLRDRGEALTCSESWQGVWEDQPERMGTRKEPTRSSVCAYCSIALDDI